MALSTLIRNRIQQEIGESIPTEERDWRHVLAWRTDLVGAKRLGKVWFHHVGGEWLPAIHPVADPTLYTGDGLVERVVRAWIAKYREETGRVI